MKNQTLLSQNEYHIVDILGEGSTSTVYRAVKRDRKESISTEIALKVFGSEDHVSVWRREFASLEKVVSPYCVRVFNFERIMDKPALCLELVEGLNLPEVLEQGSLGQNDVIEVVAQALQGLKDLWSFDLVHGDLSPKNIMISKSGQVKLLDFGLGNFDSASTRGTPFFVHESIVRGGKPSRSTDLFSLGRVLNWSSQRVKDSGQGLKEIGTAISESCGSNLSALETLKESPVGRARLADVISKRMELKKNQQSQTQDFFVEAGSLQYSHGSSMLGRGATQQANFGVKKFSRLAIATAAAMFAIFLGSLFVSRLRSTQSEVEKPANLQIRTQKWREIWFDGERKGYTPANLKQLSPGRHIIKWASPESSGEMVLTLEPGETKILTDKDFVSDGD